MNILIGISGGISAYKTLYLIRLLKKAKHQVKVILTESATQFVTPTSITALSENPTYTDLWNQPTSTNNTSSSQSILNEEEANNHNMHHITLAKWADFIIITPATANRISQLAQGECNDLLNNVVLASEAPLAIAPAMNVNMWNNPATQANINTLTQRKIAIWGPDDGIQACGDQGQGRLLEPHELMAKINLWTRPIKLPFKRIIITAGSTQEPLDPVRYISNYSSGKMGIEIAKTAYQCNAQVTLIHGPVEPKLLESLPQDINTIPIQTSEQMLAQINTHIAQGLENNEPCEVFVGCAAVADYRPKTYSKQKIKKNDDDSLTIQLVKNPDIIKYVATHKTNSLPVCAGFALENEDLITHAKQKLTTKKIDIIFANPIDSINATQSKLTALWQEQQTTQQQELPFNDKSKQAPLILKLIAQQYQRKILD